MKIGLVLGAGGTVGMAYHAGVLRALEVEGGFVPDRADLIIGTSAGSVIGAYLRTGWSTEDFWRLASDLSDGRPQAPEIMSPTFTSPMDLVRRGLGSAFVIGPIGRAVAARGARGAAPGLPRRSCSSQTEGRRRFTEELPEAWPEKPLWLCTVDIVRRSPDRARP